MQKESNIIGFIVPQRPTSLWLSIRVTICIDFVVTDLIELSKALILIPLKRSISCFFFIKETRKMKYQYLKCNLNIQSFHYIVGITLNDVIVTLAPLINAGQDSTSNLILFARIWPISL